MNVGAQCQGHLYNHYMATLLKVVKILILSPGVHFSHVLMVGG